jgi:hypothetical protein
MSRAVAGLAVLLAACLATPALADDAAVRTGVEVVGAPEFSLPRRWTLTGGPGALKAAEVAGRFGFVTVEPGEYVLSLVPDGPGAVPLTWGTVVVRAGETTRVEVRSGVVLEEDEDAPAPEGFRVRDRAGAVVAHVEGRLRATPLPPGEYSVGLLPPRGSGAAEVALGRVVVEPGALARVRLRPEAKRPGPAPPEPPTPPEGAVPSKDPTRGEVEVVYGGDAPPLALRPALNLVLDCSHSMGEPVEGRPKYLVAREVVTRLVDGLPDGLQMGLRLYGHRGTELRRREDPRAPLLRTDDPLLCTDTEPVVEIGPLTPAQRGRLRKWVAWVEPRQGRTLFVRALLETRGDFSRALRGPKTVVLVSDGLETCGGRIEDLEAAYRAPGSDLVVHVVGFDVRDPEADRQLRAVARIGGGTYARAADARSLAEALRGAASSLGYEVADASGGVVARGAVNGAPVALEPGEYRVRLVHRDAEPVAVVVARAGTSRLRVEASGALVSAP